MDVRQFDRISRIVGSSVDRRSGFRGVSAVVLALFVAPSPAGSLLPGKVEATRRKRKLRAEACIPTGKPCPSKKPRGHTKQGKARILSCNRCCQKHTAVVNGEVQCACQPDTELCALSIECCSGICTNGICGTPPPPPPPPAAARCATGKDICQNDTDTCVDNPDCLCLPRRDGTGSACISATGILGYPDPPSGACNCANDAACQILPGGAGTVCVIITNVASPFCSSYEVACDDEPPATACAVPCTGGA